MTARVPHRGYLITGGTGFLGQAVVAQLLRLPVTNEETRICIYSRGEAAQAAMRARLGDSPRLRWFIGDVRDRDRLRRAMESVNVVIHAAALKRVEVGEYNPTEMVQTNVLGSMNVIEAAIDAGVGVVVGVSSDKAVEPVNCYGATKLVMEKLFAGAAVLAPMGPRFVIVRYGNVTGSTGSVIPIWRARMAAGARLEVRDPNATRFWLTAQEAALYVIDAIMAPSGAKRVPNLPAYRLGDLYQALGADATQADFTELLPGEKDHELLLGHHEEGGPRCSNRARRMSVAELREELAKL